ncbi:MAG TPA: hypothetical protein VNJ09_07080, partial [Chthonomonadales bacterium]|nr:hypothetical protein [Chthonomonadales bacterium]
RKREEKIDPRLIGVTSVRLCCESTSEKCQRRLMVKYLPEKWGGWKVIHLQDPAMPFVEMLCPANSRKYNGRCW